MMHTLARKWGLLRTQWKRPECSNLHKAQASRWPRQASANVAWLEQVCHPPMQQHSASSFNIHTRVELLHIASCLVSLGCSLALRKCRSLFLDMWALYLARAWTVCKLQGATRLGMKDHRGKLDWWDSRLLRHNAAEQIASSASPARGSGRDPLLHLRMRCSADTPFLPRHSTYTVSTPAQTIQAAVDGSKP